MTDQERIADIRTLWQGTGTDTDFLLTHIDRQAEIIKTCEEALKCAFSGESKERQLDKIDKALAEIARLKAEEGKGPE